LKRFAKNLISGFFGHPRPQRLLERIVTHSEYLMGIGSGTSTDSSGEKVLIVKLKQLGSAGAPLCIFDVGANTGQFLSLMEHGLQGNSFHIHAFEPGQHTYKVLCENTKGYSNITLNNIGLGKQAGEVELFFEQPGSGMASLYKRRLEHFGIDFKYSEKVKIDTLDSYCRRHAVQGIDLLKLDVEGHELDVLQGGQEMFGDRKIRMVSFEFGGCNIDSRT
jgi:FkbM family methyltransferase